MGSALLDGWLNAGLKPENVIVVDPFVKPEGIKSFKSILKVPNKISPRMVVLCVKPQVMPDVLSDFNERQLDVKSVLSIAAGFKISKLEGGFMKGTAIIRAMPNTPASIGKGISGLYGNEATSKDDFKLAKGLMESCGPVITLNQEALIDAVTSISGSGPAYVFYLLEAMAKGGEAVGLSPENACLLARETIIGAGALLDASDADVKTLRENVTSPNGTTQAALNILMEDGALVTLMKRAIKAARDRGVEISES